MTHWLSGAARRRLRREKTYARIRAANNGKVPCFVCGRHVAVEQMSLEHIQPTSLGGTNNPSNLSISHVLCNQRRGNTL